MQSPAALGLPYSDWRPGQRLAIRTMLQARTPHVVVNAPTGSGKSGIVAALPLLDPTRRFIALTGTLALQDAYGIFPHLAELRGARHYPCRAAFGEFTSWFPRRKTVQCDDGPCHLQVPCSLRDEGCTYFDAKRGFIAAHAGQTSYASWLSHRRLGQPLGTADMLLCDEAHSLPEQLMQACRVDIPYALLDTTRIPQGHKQWRMWAAEKLEALAGADAQVDLEGLHREGLVRGLKLLAAIDDAWAWDEDAQGFHFEPTDARQLLPLLQTLDGRAQIAYLSATITPATLDLLGVPAQDVTYLELPSTFPVAHRPIYFCPGAPGNWKAMQSTENWADLVASIAHICEWRNDRRGLIQPVSFARGRQIVETLPADQASRCVLHVPRMPAADAIRRFREAGDRAILVSPSIMTGHDFKYRDAEFNILAKLPFPNTTSAIMRARCRRIPRYRDHYTMQHFVQACGRGVRAEDDRCETFVVDEDVRWWFKRNRDLVPRHVAEAVVETQRHVRPPKKL